MNEGDFRLPVAELQPNHDLLRSVDRDSPEYQEFAGSVKNKGVLQPILARPIDPAKVQPGGPKYQIIDGLQRWSASKDAGFHDIPVRLTNQTDKEVRNSQVVANLHRIETKPKEYAAALERMLQDDPMLTKSQLAADLDKSETWLQARLSLNRLDDEVGELVDTGKICLNNAIILAKLKDPEDQKLFAQHAMTQDPATFGGNVQTHIKEKNAAKREGRPAGPVEFVPNARFVKLTELQSFYTDDNTIAEFLQSEGVKVNKDTLAASRLSYLRVLGLNPAMVAVRKQKYEDDKAERANLAKVKAEEKAKQKELDSQSTRERMEKELGITS
jgi:ParB/RepB/Spo0J family partition protein